MRGGAPARARPELRRRPARTPHALHSVFGPAGPLRHIGVRCVPHSEHCFTPLGAAACAAAGAPAPGALGGVATPPPRKLRTAAENPRLSACESPPGLLGRGEPSAAPPLPPLPPLRGGRQRQEPRVSPRARPPAAAAPPLALGVTGSEC